MTSELIENAIKNGELKIFVQEPKEPRYGIEIDTSDPVHYGPFPTDTSPSGCAGDQCPLTLVVFYDYQCPYCVRATPNIPPLLTEYQGKIRWVGKEYPQRLHQWPKNGSRRKSGRDEKDDRRRIE